MQIVKSRASCTCGLLALALIGCAGCGSESPAEVAKVRRDPIVTLVGEIAVSGATSLEDGNEITLTFLESPDTVAQFLRFWNTNATYLVEFRHDKVCSWSLTVRIWDGRDSEMKPVSEDPAMPCTGLVTGPSFWFP